jgi:hypothetical protein
MPSGKRLCLINKAKLNFSSESAPNIASLNRNVITCRFKGRYNERAFLSHVLFKAFQSNITCTGIATDFSLRPTLHPDGALLMLLRSSNFQIMDGMHLQQQL